jgi:hypothetical protein
MSVILRQLSGGGKVTTGGIYIYNIYINVCVCVCVRLCMYGYMYTCMYVYIYELYEYPLFYVCGGLYGGGKVTTGGMCVCVYVCLYVCVCVCICIYIICR